MPSANMTRFHVDLYDANVTVLKEVITKRHVPRSRFFRECILVVLKDPELLSQVVRKCHNKQYLPRK